MTAGKKAHIVLTPEGNDFVVHHVVPRETTDHLPAGVYTPLVQTNPDGTITIGFKKYADKFNQVDDIRYGVFNKLKSSILSQYRATKKGSFGALAIGRNGSGKTLLGEDVANNLIAQGLPIIFIRSFVAPDIIHSLAKIAGPCMVFFDEFGKVFSMKDKDSSSDRLMGEFLMLFSDSSLNNVLFYVTSNDTDDIINNGLINRPSRFRQRLPVNFMEISSYMDMITKSVSNADMRNFLIFNTLDSKISGIADGFSSDNMRFILSHVTDEMTPDELIEKLIFQNVPNLAYHRISLSSVSGSKADYWYEFKSFKNYTLEISAKHKKTGKVEIIKHKFDLASMALEGARSQAISENKDNDANIIIPAKNGMDFHFFQIRIYCCTKVQHMSISNDFPEEEAIQNIEDNEDNARPRSGLRRPART